MIVAINIADFLKEGFFRSKLIDTYSKLAQSNSADTYYLIIDKDFDTPKSLPINMTCLPITFTYRSTALSWLNYQVKIARTIKKCKADKLLTSYIINKRLLKTPQTLLFPSIDFIHHQQYYSPQFSAFFKKQASKFINKSDQIITANNYTKNEIVRAYKTNINKIQLLSSTEISINNDDQQLKEKYAQGNEYFYCRHTATDVNSLTNILKAFSLFKKRLKSSMRLLVSVNNRTAEAAINKSLNTYKYKEEVSLIKSITEEENALITRGCYGKIFSAPLSDFETISPAATIAANVDSLGALFGPDALYFNNEPTDIAEKMMNLYKDEALRSKLQTSNSKL